VTRKPQLSLEALASSGCTRKANRRNAALLPGVLGDENGLPHRKVLAWRRDNRRRLMLFVATELIPAFARFFFCGIPYFNW